MFSKRKAIKSNQGPTPGRGCKFVSGERKNSALEKGTSPSTEVGGLRVRNIAPGGFHGGVKKVLCSEKE